MSNEETPKRPSSQPKQPAAGRRPDDDEEEELPPDADIEERFNDFMKRNGPAIFAAIVLAGLIVIGVQGYQYMGERAQAIAQEDYQAAETREDKIAFAENNEKFQLAGIAYLEAADSYFDESDFANARQYYSEAERVLSPGPFRGRARIGSGLSSLLMGETDEGNAVLNQVANDVQLLDQIRAEAAYHLAVSEWEVGNYEGVQLALDTIHALDRPGFWESRALDLEERIPELAGLE